MKHALVTIALAAGLLAPSFSRAANAGDAEAIKSCLEHWKKHPFTGANPDFRIIKGKVRVMGIGDGIDDSGATKSPELVLIKPNVSVLSKTEMKLMNPNGWYCLKGNVSVLGKTVVELQCKANLASSEDGATVLGASETGGGVAVLGSLRVEREGCQAGSSSGGKADEQPAAKSDTKSE
jgi:hypothetical protein